MGIPSFRMGYAEPPAAKRGINKKLRQARPISSGLSTFAWSQSMKVAMIEAKGIRKSFGKLEVLKGIDLKVDEGEVVSVVGPSGAGKTTLLQILGTLDQPSSGEVWLDGHDITRLSPRKQAEVRNKQVGFVFQFHQLLLEFSAVENIMLPALIGGESRRTALKRAQELLRFLKLEDRADHRPAELSGGENQRVAVARALINQPKILLADEPSGSLDSENKASLHQLFFDLRKTYGTTIVIVTHDDELASLCDRTIHIRDGVVSEIQEKTAENTPTEKQEEKGSEAEAADKEVQE